MSNVTSFVPAPEGYIVDFENPQRQGELATYCCFGVGMSLAMLFTAQRVYVQLGLGSNWQIDDTLLSVAWLASFISQICVVSGFVNGFIGVHAWEISVAQYNRFLLDLWISAPIYVLAGSCTKLALLVFYLRISPQRWLHYGAYAMMAFITCYSAGIFFSLIFACNPVQKSFDVSITTGTCISSGALYIATAFCNIASDVMLFVLPMPMILVLQMPLKQKLGLLFIFGIGSITVITSVLRAWILPQLLTSTDNTWDVTYASMLIVIEANLMIICGMLPTLRKFFRHVAPRIIGESTYGKPNSRMPSLGGGGGGGGGGCGVALGSLPPEGVNDDKFGRDHHEEYALDVDEGHDARTAIKKGHVDVRIVGGCHRRDADGRRRRSQDSVDSSESQVPMVSEHGIMTTTRISVSYSLQEPGVAV